MEGAGYGVRCEALDSRPKRVEVVASEDDMVLHFFFVSSIMRMCMSNSHNVEIETGAQTYEGQDGGAWLAQWVDREVAWIPRSSVMWNTAQRHH